MTPPNSMPFTAFLAQKPLLHNVLAGLSVAAILLPESVVYASIAGVTPIHALSATLIGLIFYALLGGSRGAIVSPTSSAATIFAGAMAIHTQLGFALVIVTGLMFIVAGVLKGGFIGSYLSRPIMQGFAWSLALLIIAKQIPHLLGIGVVSQTFFPLLAEIVSRLSDVNVASGVLGILALVLWLLLNKLHCRWLPASLMVLMVGTLASAVLNLKAQGVAVLGAIPLDSVGLFFPTLSMEMWLQAVYFAPALLLIIFAESWESVKLLSAKSVERINPNQELKALGVANVLSGLTGSLPVGAGFSASNASLVAGATSRMAGVVTATALAVLIWLGRDILALMPLPVLSAVVVGILSKHLVPKALLRSLKLGADSYLALVCVASVLLFGVIFGMTVSVGLSIIWVLYRFSKPNVEVLGRLRDSHDFVEVTHSHAHSVPRVLIVRPKQPLFFANAERIFDAIWDHIWGAIWQAAKSETLPADGQPVSHVVISLESSNDLDSTSLYALQDFCTRVQALGVTVVLTRMKDTAHDDIQRFFRYEQLPELPMYWSVDDAVTACVAMQKLGQ